MGVGGGGGGGGGVRGAYAASQTTALHMNQNESPIFVILFVIFFCFQRPFFLTFISFYCSWCCAVWRQKVSPYIIIVQVVFYFLWDH